MEMDIFELKSKILLSTVLTLQQDPRFLLLVNRRLSFFDFGSTIVYSRKKKLQTTD